MDYNWDFPALHVAREGHGLSHIVTAIDWRLTATGAEGISASVSGRAGIGDPAPEAFTDFDQLTPEQVQGWIEAELGDDLTTIKAGLVQRIDDMTNPPVAVLAPPWSSPTSEA